MTRTLNFEPATYEKIAKDVIERLTQDNERKIKIVLEEEGDETTDSKEKLFSLKLTVQQKNINEYIAVALAISERLLLEGEVIQELRRKRTRLQRGILTYIIGALLHDYMGDYEEMTQEERKYAFELILNNHSSSPEGPYKAVISILRSVKINLDKEIEINATNKKHGKDTKKILKDRIANMTRIMATERDYSTESGENHIQEIEEYLRINSPSMGVGNILLIACLVFDIEASPNIIHVADSLDRYLRLYNDFRTHHHEGKITAIDFFDHEDELHAKIMTEKHMTKKTIDLIEEERIKTVAERIFHSITIRYEKGEFEKQ